MDYYLSNECRSDARLGWPTWLSCGIGLVYSRARHHALALASGGGIKVASKAQYPLSSELRRQHRSSITWIIKQYSVSATVEQSKQKMYDVLAYLGSVWLQQNAVIGVVTAALVQARLSRIPNRIGWPGRRSCMHEFIWSQWYFSQKINSVWITMFCVIRSLKFLLYYYFGKHLRFSFSCQFSYRFYFGFSFYFRFRV